MNINDIVEELFQVKHLKRNDYFSGCIFYYLAGRYPEFTIAQCADIVSCACQKLVKKRDGL